MAEYGKRGAKTSAQDELTAAPGTGHAAVPTIEQQAERPAESGRVEAAEPRAAGRDGGRRRYVALPDRGRNRPPVMTDVAQLAGVSHQTVSRVLNDHPNVPRLEYDRLRALLHNAARDGPAAHNRGAVPDLEAHVRGGQVDPQDETGAGELHRRLREQAPDAGGEPVEARSEDVV